MNSNTAFPKLMACSYLSRSQPRTYRMATPTNSTIAMKKTTSSMGSSSICFEFVYALLWFRTSQG
jgi:hypothetical protein